MSQTMSRSDPSPSSYPLKAMWLSGTTKEFGLIHIEREMEVSRDALPGRNFAICK